MICVHVVLCVQAAVQISIAGWGSRPSDWLLHTGNHEVEHRASQPKDTTPVDLYMTLQVMVVGNEVTTNE